MSTEIKVAYAHCPKCKSSFYGEGKTVREARADAAINMATEHTELACKRTQAANKKSGI